jgi:RNA polymerase sigma factor (sigma-70 family)
LFVAREAQGNSDGHAEAEAVAPEPGPERLAELAQAKRCIEQCLAKLGVQHREVLALRVCGAELKEQEVARLLGVPLGTVKSRTSIALRLLAACVERCAGTANA